MTADTAPSMSPDPRTGIEAPVVSGSGVVVVHRALAAQIAGYAVKPLSPYWGLLPPAARMVMSRAPIVHSLPELGPWIAHRDSILIGTFHNYYLDEELARFATPNQRRYYRYVLAPSIAAGLRRARWITAVSRVTADLVKQHHALGSRLVLIRNGIDIDGFTPAAASREEGGTIRILFSGNPTLRKGADHLHALAEALPDGVSLLYTKGMRDSAIGFVGESAKLVGIPRRPHEEMPELYRSADIFFFPSLREGLSLSLAEAMACGLPVVASRASSIPEMIDHGKGGFLFEPNDRLQMLAYLRQLIGDPKLRAEMGAYNRAKCVAEFSMSRMVGEYRQLFSMCGAA